MCLELDISHSIISLRGVLTSFDSSESGESDNTQGCLTMQHHILMFCT